MPLLRFSTLALGKLARHTIQLPLPGIEPVSVDVRPLDVVEESDAIDQARALAKARGATEPKEGDATYDLLIMATVVLRGCVATDSPKDAPIPFFDNVEQVMTLGRDWLVYLYEAHELWREQCSPRQLDLPPEKYGALIAHLLSSEGDPGAPFGSLSRYTLITFARSLARRLVASLNSPQLKSSPTSGSDTQEPSDSTESPETAADPGTESRS